MPTEIVGREAVLAEVERFAARVTEASSALVLRGEPGIGKSTVWAAAADRLAHVGCLVLESRPGEAEVRFGFAAMRDVLRPVEDHIARLPMPMAHALRVVLLRDLAAERPVDSGTVEAAMLALVRDLAVARPVVIAIDDVQWLDEPSRVAFAYIARRVRDSRVGFLFAERVEAGATPRSRWFAEGLGADRVTELPFQPLTLGAVHHLLRSRLGLALPRPRLVRLHELAGGNPFYALEIADAWRRSGDQDVSEIPASLRELLARRLRALPAFTRRVLLAAALASGDDVRVNRISVIFEVDPSRIRDALEPAIEANVIARSADRIRFTHPLLAAAARAEASPEEARGTHERLAETATGSEARARHLSVAREPPDAEVAAALDEAAAIAGSRGAATDAAELRRLAVRFSGPGDAGAPRRAVDLGEAEFIAGDMTAAHRSLMGALDGIGDRELRLRALLLLATITWYEETTAAALPFGDRALEEAKGDPLWLGRVHARMAWLCDIDLARAQRHAAAALALVDADAEPALYAFALLNDAYLRLLLGVAADHAAIEQGWELQETAAIWEFSTLAGNWAKLMDQFDIARERLGAYLDRVRAQGDESSIGQLVGYLAELQAWTGDLGRAGSLAAEAIELAEQTGQSGYLIQGLRHRALLGVMSGQLAAARVDAARALALAEEIGDPMLEAGACATCALVALTDGDLAMVDRLCTRAVDRLDGIGMVDHAPYRFQADHIEALVGLGELDRAQAMLDRHAARGRLGPRPWILATAERCDGLLRSARGDAEGAAAAFARARGHHGGLDMPFELGRTLLAEGQVARRANRRRDAMAALGQALEIFERLGSADWAARARSEIARVGIRRGRREDLTATELDVARLAATGLTNREMAAELYISPKTVEANLSRVYAKLGIRSRAELGAVMAARGAQPEN